ncbi:MAG: crossover junction endodeoxyribonuclease RuvC [Bdellovibrionales bacterium]
MILGLDPGSLVAGFGLIVYNGSDVGHLENGVVEMSPRLPLASRLFQLQSALAQIFVRHTVTDVVVEKAFFGKNADSAFKLGQARGVCMAAAGGQRVSVHEYAARFVKKAVTGSGSASKEHVQLIVGQLLRLRVENVKFDATDALALAIAHSREIDKQERLRQAWERSPERQGAP